MKACVISRQSLGDGLLMMIASSFLKQEGYNVFFYHRLFHEFKKFFVGYSFLNLKNLESINSGKENHFSTYDIIIVEHFKTPIIETLLENREKFKNLYIFYPTKNIKNIKLHKNDFVFDKKKTMAENIKISMKAIFKKPFFTKNLDIEIPKNLKFKKFSKRVVIHPISNCKKKNWRKKRFVKLFKKLKKMGFDPIFSLAPHERFLFKEKNIKTIFFSNFHNLASFIFESGFFIGNDSGPAHLASLLKIPTIVIASNKRTMKLWKPDFSKTELLLPINYIINFKGFRMKDRFWAFFINTKKVLKTFLKISNHAKKTTN